MSMEEDEDSEKDEDEEDENDDYDFVAAMFNLAEVFGVSLDQKAITEKPLLTSFLQ
jgi:hypothetical protein